MRIRCTLCKERLAVRLVIRLDNGDDVPVCGECLRKMGIIGRPLPQVLVGADNIAQEQMVSDG